MTSSRAGIAITQQGPVAAQPDAQRQLGPLPVRAGRAVRLLAGLRVRRRRAAAHGNRRHLILLVLARARLAVETAVASAAAPAGSRAGAEPDQMPDQVSPSPYLS
jgi:hypothetical protein